MKSTKSLIALSLVLFLSINLATAQRGAKDVSPEVRAEKQTEKMAKLLSLSENQSTEVTAINLDYADKMKELKAASTKREAAAKAEMKKLRDERENAIKAILNPEQLEKLAETRKEASEKLEERKKARSPEGRAEKQTERMTELLDLSPEQSSKISHIILSYTEKTNTLRASKIDKTAAKSAFKKLREDRAQEIEAVLTPEQLVNFKESKEDKEDKKGKRGKTEMN